MIINHLHLYIYKSDDGIEEEEIISDNCDVSNCVELNWVFFADESMSRA